MPSLLARGAAVAAFLAAGLAPGPAGAQVPYTQEYAVKVVCGGMDGASGGFAPGRYFTVVNIHNPNVGRAYIRRKVAVAKAGEPGPISGWETGKLEYDEAMAVTCEQILRQSGGARVDGFLVVQSSKSLDVVAVYTTSGRDESVNSFHTERVPARPIPRQ